MRHADASQRLATEPPTPESARLRRLARSVQCLATTWPCRAPVCCVTGPSLIHSTGLRDR